MSVCVYVCEQAAPADRETPAKKAEAEAEAEAKGTTGAGAAPVASQVGLASAGRGPGRFGWHDARDAHDAR